MSTSSPRLSVYRPVLDRLFFIIALVGLLDVTHLYLQHQRGFDRGCFGVVGDDPTALFDCGTVVGSAAGTFLGVSNITWGGVFYLTMALLSAALLLVRPAHFVWLKRARGALAVFGVGYSAYLVYYQAAVLDQFCKLCLISAGCALAFFITFLIDVSTTPKTSTSKPMSRLFSAARETRLFAGLAVLALVLMGADTLYFSQLDEPATEPLGPISLEIPIPDDSATTGATSSAPGTTGSLSFDAPAPLLTGTADCGFKEDIPRWDDYMSLVNINDPYLGNFDADVTVIEIFEVNCPHCRSWHPDMKKIVEANADKAKFYFVPVVFGAHSVGQTSLLLMAAQEGKYFEALDLVFERQASLGRQAQQLARAGQAMGQAQQNGGDVATARATFQSEQNRLNGMLKATATELGLDGDALVSRIQSNTYIPVMQAQNEKISEGGITSVPTVLINGQAVDDRNVSCVNSLIEQAAGS